MHVRYKCLYISVPSSLNDQALRSLRNANDDSSVMFRISIWNILNVVIAYLAHLAYSRVLNRPSQSRISLVEYKSFLTTRLSRLRRRLNSLIATFSLNFEQFLLRN